MSREREVWRAKARRRMEGLDRRKHWGADTLISEYEETVVDNLDLSELEDRLDELSEGFSEGLIDNLMSSVDFQDLFAASTVDDLQGLIAESFKQGGSRVLTTDGDRLGAFDVDPRRIKDQLEAQEIFLKNLRSDAEEKVRDVLVRGSEEGKSIGEMRDDILGKVEGLTKHRAETISRSEIITASGKGTKEAVREAGVERLEVNASIDRQTCEPGSFEWTGPGGRTFTSCREWDQVEFPRESAPTPVVHSHPNCRCALLAVID